MSGSRHGGLYGCHLEPSIHAFGALTEPCSSILIVSTLEGAFNLDTLRAGTANTFVRGGLSTQNQWSACRVTVPFTSS